VEQIRCIKYNGEKESRLHDTLKNLIGFYLRQDKNVSAVMIDEVYKDKAISKEWRKPDVLADFNGKTIAFELQLSTTFLSVIVGRTIFYQQRGVFLIWVFPNFSLNIDLQKFTQKDVYYNNNFNVYVFNEEAQVKSKEANELILTCYYKVFNILNETIREKWVKAFVKLTDLTFDFHNANVCFYDSDAEKKELQVQIEILKTERIKREEERSIQEKVDRVLNYLRQYYTHDNELIPRSEEFPLDYIKSDKEIIALDNKLRFTTEKVSFIANLFHERKKQNFLKFICEQDNILIDTSKLSVDGKPIFEELLNLHNREEFKHLIACLFRKGYKLSEDEKVTRNNIYRKNFTNMSEHEREQIDRWAIVDFLSNLENKGLVFDLMQIDKILFAITSLKSNMIIGFRFNNHRQITNNILEHHKEFGEVYFKAMKVYGYCETQIKQDKTGKLKLKMDRFFTEMPQQDRRYDEIINELFPELQT